ncbi:MAG: magnesium transporter [Anaerolineales bacterium]|nr:magnesium transporter [Anaerolineales bacterium]
MDPSTIEATLEEIRTALEGDRIEEAIVALINLHPVDRAEAFADLNDQDQAVILPQLNINDTADLLEELDDEEAADVAETLSTPFLADILDAMEPDEAADVLGDLPPGLAADALAEMEDSENVIPLLVFPDETAGGLMTTHILTLTPEITAAEAIEYLRQTTMGSDTPYYLYVVEHDGRLIGVVGLRDLVIADPNRKISEIVDPNVISAKTDLDQEDVARLMVRYDLAALPIVDDDGGLLGVITHDDLMDVIEDEATEDIYHLANVHDRDLSFDSPVGLSVRRRLPWLFLSGVTALFASWVISQFETIIAQVALLAAFQSVVAGLGGNTATQTLAIIVRAIALDEIEPRDAWRTLVKEAAVGLLQGLFVGAAAAIGVYLWTGNEFLGLVLGLALVGNMIIATMFGTLVPLILRWLGADPALASTVLVTAVTDSVGFALFLGLASIFVQYMR